jgi:uncharacterized protein (DUF1501 family)
MHRFTTPPVDELISAHGGCSRRDFLSKGLAGLGMSAALPALLQNTSLAMAAEALQSDAEQHPNRILVVVELTGGNDGLNTIVPYGHDEYYRARPTLGIRKGQVLKVNDEFGLDPQLLGLHRLFMDGKIATIHGCGYENSTQSHFKSMEFWHTGRPWQREFFGWAGRTADAMQPEPVDSIIVNLGTAQSLAVKSRIHAPIVFQDPNRFTRNGLNSSEKELVGAMDEAENSANSSLAFLRGASKAATASSARIKRACQEYQTTMNYGGGNLSSDLRNIAALIAGGFQTKIYYANIGGWDTHSDQNAGRGTVVHNLDDSLSGFLEDLKRMGRADDVAVMVFSEFGRRVQENASGGTDHGTAGPMFIIGEKVKGGFYGEHPSLSYLDNGNLKVTTDFRRVYATMIKEWLGFDDAETILKGDFETFNTFA